MVTSRGLRLTPSTGLITKTKATNNFVADLLKIMGDVRALYLFDTTGTTLTDKSINQQVLTWSEEVSNFDTPPTSLGIGTSVTFNGTDEEGDIPDTDNLSFGDGVNDEPFSIIALINATDATNSHILTKIDNTTSSEDREYTLVLDGSDRLTFALNDESTNGELLAQDSSAFTEGSWALVAATYDGSSTLDGMKVFIDAVDTTDTRTPTGVYTAMENGSTNLMLGHNLDTSGNPANFFDGQMALVVLVAKELLVDELWLIKEAVNGYFGLSL